MVRVRDIDSNINYYFIEMTPCDIFGIIVRTFGLSLVIYAIWYLVYGIATMAGLPEEAPGYGVAFFISGGTYLTMGSYLLRGAPGVIRFAYPKQATGDEPD